MPFRTTPSPDPSHDLSSVPDADRSLASWFLAYGIWIVAFAVLAACASTLLFFSFTADDAFISFRYGKNLVFHHVWNWNTADPREEAYTSALYTAIAVLAFLLHLPVILLMKAFGVLCMAVMIYRLCTVSSSNFARVLGAMAIGISPVLWVHVYSCLETPLYMLLILEMAIAVQRAEPANAKWIYALFLLLPLTRPEGLIFASAGVVLFWLACGQNFKRLALFGLAFLLGVLYFLLRWQYFHHLMPNPFYVKVDHRPLRDQLGVWLTNLADFKGYVLSVLLIALIGRQRVTRTFALCGLALMVALFAPHRMQMNYADRFYLQLAFPALLIFLIFEDTIRLARLSLVVVVLFVFAYSPADWLKQLKYPANIKRAHIDIGQRLAPFAAGHTLLAGDVGAIPYFSNWFAYDSIGLATNSIAQHRLTVDTLAAMHPDLIILYNQNPGPGLLHDRSWVGDPKWTGAAIVAYLNASDDYDYAGSSQSNGFYLVSFLRRDTPQHDAILATLQQNNDAPVREPSLKAILLQKYMPPLY